MIVYTYLKIFHQQFQILGNVHEVESLIRNRANINFMDNLEFRTHVHRAVLPENNENMRQNRYKILQLLINNGAKFDERSKSG